MPPIDPFAPADSPRHPRQAGSNRVADRQRRAEQEVAERAELEATHVTDLERETDALDYEVTLDVLRLRRDALMDHLEARAQSDEVGNKIPGAPIILDATGVEHELILSDDGATARWEPLQREQPEGDGESPADDGAGPQEQPQAQDDAPEDMAAKLAALDRVKRPARGANRRTKP
jgi:hypothetical protein